MDDLQFAYECKEGEVSDDWSGYCTSPSYCTRSCVDCLDCERHARSHHG